VARIGVAGGVRQNVLARRVALNIVRAVASVAAFGCLAAALFVHGRTVDAAPSRPSPAPALAVPAHPEALSR
jgi:hypothetical protein